MDLEQEIERIAIKYGNPHNALTLDLALREMAAFTRKQTIAKIDTAAQRICEEAEAGLCIGKEWSHESQPFVGGVG